MSKSVEIICKVDNKWYETNQASESVYGSVRSRSSVISVLTQWSPAVSLKEEEQASRERQVEIVVIGASKC
jgi:hypothetical protein